jgi:(p)ppGpp synthase/HD superfamily hydrolase
MIDLALKIATQAHLGQVDKLGNDYMSYPTRVASKFAGDHDLQAISYMHDVLEDSTVTEEELRKLFSSHIVNAVIAITKKDGQLYADYLKQVKANGMALAVELADIEDNMSRLDQITDAATRERLTEKYQHALKALVDDHNASTR